MFHLGWLKPRGINIHWYALTRSAKSCHNIWDGKNSPLIVPFMLNQQIMMRTTFSETCMIIFAGWLVHRYISGTDEKVPYMNRNCGVDRRWPPLSIAFWWSQSRFRWRGRGIGLGQRCRFCSLYKAFVHGVRSLNDIKWRERKRMIERERER